MGFLASIFLVQGGEYLYPGGMTGSKSEIPDEVLGTFCKGDLFGNCPQIPQGCEVFSVLKVALEQNTYLFFFIV